MSHPLRVTLFTKIVTHYRLKFHELVRENLAQHGVEYVVCYSEPNADEKLKGDTVDISWGRKVSIFEKGRGVAIQAGVREFLSSNLSISTQENRLLLNYYFQIIRSSKHKFAFFGHGRNFQSRNPSSLSERWKRIWATKVDWWFGYTEETRRHVEALGFPSERITIFNNSIDTSELRNKAATVSAERLAELRADMKLGAHTGIFVGGIYPDKRISFLVEAVDLIRVRVPDFNLIVVGGGTGLSALTKVARDKPWIRVMGPRFDTEKVELMMLAQVFMMPGLMGLAILDAGALGLPVATTAFPWHSPEIAYLEPERNGIMVQEWENVEAYAKGVADLLLDPLRQEAMSKAARIIAEQYSVEAMAARFSLGILDALAA